VKEKLKRLYIVDIEDISVVGTKKLKDIASFYIVRKTNIFLL